MVDVTSRQSPGRMRRRLYNWGRFVLWFICLLFIYPNANAYEQATHIFITEQAFLRTDFIAFDDSASGLVTNILYLDLPYSTSLAFGGGTCDVFALSEAIGIGAYNFAIAACIAAQGAFDEDEHFRPGNHFFDYQPWSSGLSNGALNNFVFGVPPLGLTLFDSPDWILKGAGQLQSFLGFLYGTPYTYDNFTIDGVGTGAKQAYLLALTAPTQQARQQAATQLFLAVGHVLHHLQDMAQPQHVRNDNHCNPGVPAGDQDPFTALGTEVALCAFSGSLYAPSAYEAYAAENAESTTSLLPANSGLPLENGAVPFSLPQDFWQSSSYGIPAFTSLNFFSARTNLSQLSGVPPFSPASEPNPSFGRLSLANALSATNLTKYYQLTIENPIDVKNPTSGMGTTTVHLATAQSALATLFPELSFGSAGFKLTPAIYQDQMDTLVPQAVAYSQFFVDWIFRGAIYANLAADGTLTIYNFSTTESLTGGSFQLYVDDANYMRSPVGNSCSMTIGPSTSASTTSASCNVGRLSVMPANGADTDDEFVCDPYCSNGYYLLVYSGSIGQEPRQVAVTPVKALPYTGSFNIQGKGGYSTCSYNYSQPGDVSFYIPALGLTLDVDAAVVTAQTGAPTDQYGNPCPGVGDEVDSGIPPSEFNSLAYVELPVIAVNQSSVSGSFNLCQPTDICSSPIITNISGTISSNQIAGTISIGGSAVASYIAKLP